MGLCIATPLRAAGWSGAYQSAVAIHRAKFNSQCFFTNVNSLSKFEPDYKFRMK